MKEKITVSDLLKCNMALKELGEVEAPASVAIHIARLVRVLSIEIETVLKQINGLVEKYGAVDKTSKQLMVRADSPKWKPYQQEVKAHATNTNVTSIWHGTAWVDYKSMGNDIWL